MMDQINHFVVLLMENRSFDHVLGSLSLSGRSDINGNYGSYGDQSGSQRRRGASMVHRSCTPRL
jgi:phospholipase C